MYKLLYRWSIKLTTRRLLYLSSLLMGITTTNSCEFIREEKHFFAERLAEWEKGCILQREKTRQTDREHSTHPDACFSSIKD